MRYLSGTNSMVSLGAIKDERRGKFMTYYRET